MPDAVPGSAPIPQRILTLVTSNAQPPTAGSQMGVKVCLVCSRPVSSTEIVPSDIASNPVCVACSQVTRNPTAPIVSSIDTSVVGPHPADSRALLDRSSEPVSRVALPRIDLQDQKVDTTKVSDDTVSSANILQVATVPTIAIPNGKNRQMAFPSLGSAPSLETSSVQVGMNNEQTSPTIHLNSPVLNKMFIPSAKDQAHSPSAGMAPSSPVTSYHLSSALKHHREMQSLLDPFPSLANNRVSSSGYECLYPGAQFTGIQTNRDKEHRVTVKIVVNNTPIFVLFLADNL